MYLTINTFFVTNNNKFLPLCLNVESIGGSFIGNLEFFGNFAENATTQKIKYYRK